MENHFIYFLLDEELATSIRTILLLYDFEPIYFWYTYVWLWWIYIISMRFVAHNITEKISYILSSFLLLLRISLKLNIFKQNFWQNIQTKFRLKKKETPCKRNWQIITYTTLLGRASILMKCNIFTVFHRLVWKYTYIFLEKLHSVSVLNGISLIKYD
jgi:hypothetical protein